MLFPPITKSSNGDTILSNYFNVTNAANAGIGDLLRVF